MSVEVTVQESTVAVSDSLVSITTTRAISTVGTIVPVTQSLANLSDVDTTGKIDKSLLIYDASAGAFSTASGTTTENLSSDGGNF